MEEKNTQQAGEALIKWKIESTGEIVLGVAQSYQAS